MQTGNRILDDIARMAMGAAGTAGAVRDEIEALMRDQLQRLLDDMELVRREDFEAVRAMAENARIEQERLQARVVALEERFGSCCP